MIELEKNYVIELIRIYIDITLFENLSDLFANIFNICLKNLFNFNLIDTQSIIIFI